MKRVKYTIHSTACGEFPELIGDADHIRSAAFSVAREMASTRNMVTVRHEPTMQHVTFRPQYHRPDFLRQIPWIVRTIRGIHD